MIELVLLGKRLKQIRSKLPTIVGDESMWNSIAAEVTFGGLNDGG